MSKEIVLLVVFVAVVAGWQIHSVPSAPPLASAAAERIPFSLLAETRPDKDNNPVYPEKLLASNGHPVSMTGFIAPFGDPQDLTKLILVPAGGGCFFCAPPSATGVVLVRRSGKETVNVGDARTFEGKLCLNLPDMKDEEARHFLFTLDQAKVVSAP